MLYLARRLGQAVFVLWGAFTVTFFVLFGLPGDPAIVMLTATGVDAADLDPAAVEAVRAQYGFDQPLPVQYLHALGSALTGDFGASYSMRQPVTEIIAKSVPVTALLAACTVLVAALIGIALAMTIAYTRSPRLRQILLAYPPIAISMPNFWLGLLLLQLFSFQLGWLPAAGTGAGVASLVLPVITLAVWASAPITQVLSRSLLGTQREPFVETARAKGLSRWRTLRSHSLRNASIPALTITGVVIGGVFSGAAVTETVFSWNGLGRLTVTAVGARDIPLMLGIVTFTAIVYVLVSFAVDATYPLIDPRIARAAGRDRRRPAAAHPPRTDAPADSENAPSSRGAQR
ncbi:MAG: ABC transporter permease [Microbacterium sp.]